MLAHVPCWPGTSAAVRCCQMRSDESAAVRWVRDNQMRTDEVIWDSCSQMRSDESAEVRCSLMRSDAVRWIQMSQLRSNEVRWVSCSQMRSDVVSCSQMRSDVVICSQMRSDESSAFRSGQMSQLQSDEVKRVRYNHMRRVKFSSSLHVDSNQRVATVETWPVTAVRSKACATLHCNGRDISCHSCQIESLWGHNSQWRTLSVHHKALHEYGQTGEERREKLNGLTVRTSKLKHWFATSFLQQLPSLITS